MVEHLAMCRFRYAQARGDNAARANGHGRDPIGSVHY